MVRIIRAILTTPIPGTEMISGRMLLALGLIVWLLVMLIGCTLHSQVWGL